MTLEHVFFKKGERLCSSYLVSKVNLDEIEDNNVQLFLLPYERDVEIALVRYGLDFEIKEKKHLDCFIRDCYYDKKEDKIELEVFSGFDEFIFNICALLGVGRITLDDNVEVSSHGFAPIYEKVKSITLSLEEFEQLDGFVGEFSICNPSKEFLNLRIAIKEISERVGNGSETPEVNSEYLLRGENLFIWD